MPAKVAHQGSCHCGRVCFKVMSTPVIEVLSCNCSICSSTGFLHLIVATEDFQLLQGDGSLTEYRFNTKTAKHLFCRYCGVKSFYIPRSHPSAYSVNVNYLNRDSIEAINIKGASDLFVNELLEPIISNSCVVKH